MTTHILIADGSSLTVVGAETLLKGRADTEITKVEDGSALLKAAETAQPDLILIGDRFDPLIDTLALVERIHRAAPSIRVIVMGTPSDGLLIRDYFAVGAIGYLMVGDDLTTCLRKAVELALKNSPYLSPTANAEYLVAMKSPLRDWKLDAEARTVLRLLARGSNIADIANQLNIPLRRAYWVRLKLRRRFGASTNEHLISMALQEGYTFRTS